MSQLSTPKVGQQYSQQNPDVMMWQSQLVTPPDITCTPQPQGQLHATPLGDHQYSRGSPPLNPTQPSPRSSTSPPSTTNLPPKEPFPSPPHRHRHHHPRPSNPSSQKQCPSCPIICRRPSDLRRHIDEVHRKIRFHCTFEGCAASYPRETKLRSHCRTKHL
jgi:hypothetical protein